MTNNNDNPQQILIPFFIITFLFSWFFWLIAVLVSFYLFTALLFHTAVYTTPSLFPPIEQKPGRNQLAMTFLAILYFLPTAVVLMKERQTFLKIQKDSNNETVV